MKAAAGTCSVEVGILSIVSNAYLIIGSEASNTITVTSSAPTTTSTPTLTGIANEDATIAFDSTSASNYLLI